MIYNNAGAIAGRSTRPGAFYFPAPRDKRGESEKMRLCKKNAEKLVGKKVDRRRRIFGYYPIEIIKINGELYAKDAAGVCSPIPESENDFNCYNYDFVIN